MARKVLISFLGTGPSGNDKKKGQDYSKREYRIAKYRIQDKEYDTSFIADALTDHYGIDTIIMIGTVKSMWEEVYKKFIEKRGLNIDEDVYFDLGANSEQTNYNSPLILPHKEKIEKVLGKDSKIVLIKYGLNEEELDYNISTILGLEKALQSGDEIFVDVTHSFRSLPLLLMNSLIYLQNVSKRNIKINSVSYGMIEMQRELNYTPVVDLKKILEVNDWITAAYSFSEFGNAYKISKLLKEIDKDISVRLNDFSNACNLNNMAALQKIVRQLSGINLDNLPVIAKMTIGPVVKEFTGSIGKIKSSAEFQFKLAQWQNSKHNYYAAYLTLVESMITYVCEVCDLDSSDINQRNEAKDILRYKHPEILYLHPKLKILAKEFKKISETRNNLAHAGEMKANNISTKNKMEDAFNSLKNIILSIP